MPVKPLSDSDFAEQPAKKTGALSDDDFGGVDYDGSVVMQNPNYVTQEQHPDIGFMERLKAKTFSNNPKSTLEYLKQNHPDLEFARDKEQILVKSPGEEQFKVLDPQNPLYTWKGIKDIPADVAESVYDLGAGAASSLAGGAAALSAAPATLGIGSVPAAMTAAGATGASAEALRQKIGQALGIPQEMDYKQVGMSGLVNAAAPLAFGTGAGAGAVKSAMANSTEAEIAKTIARQRGGAGYAYDYLKGNLLPKVGGAMSGASTESVRDLSKHLPQIETLEKDGVTDYIQGSHQRLVKTIAQRKKQAGQALEEAINSVDGGVDISAAKDPLKRLIDEMESQEVKTPAFAEKLAEVKSTYNRIFGVARNEADEAAEAAAPKLLDHTGKEMTPTPKPPKEISNKVSANDAFRLQEDLADAADLASTKSGLLSRLTGKAPADKRLAERAREGYNAINDTLETATSNADNVLGSSGALKSEYRRLSQIQKTLNPYFKDPQTTYQTLMTMGRKNKKMLYEQLEQIDKEMGTKMIDDARMMEGYSIFSKPSLDPLSSGGVTSTSRSIPLAESAGDLGYLMGAGHGPGMGVAGRAMLRPLGQKLGSPAAIRKMVEFNRGVIEPGRSISPYMMMPIDSLLNAKPRE